MYKYFELLDHTSYRLEDLWLNILESLNLNVPNQATVFKLIHHQGFRNIILKDPLFREILAECEEYRESGYVYNDPGKYLDKIYSIRKSVNHAEEPYEVFFHFYPRSSNLKTIF